MFYKVVFCTPCTCIVQTLTYFPAMISNSIGDSRKRPPPSSKAIRWVFVSVLPEGFFQAALVQLPDGRVVKVEGERYQAPECLFQPHLIDVEQPGIAGSAPLVSVDYLTSDSVHCRTYLPNRASRSSGHTDRPLQARASVRWINDVPWSTKQT